jgi:hypothetical protein
MFPAPCCQARSTRLIQARKAGALPRLADAASSLLMARSDLISCAAPSKANCELIFFNRADYIHHGVRWLRAGAISHLFISDAAVLGLILES